MPSGAAVAFELMGEGDPAWLHPDEEQFVVDAVASRRRQFAAGRACARAALVASGREPVAIVRSVGRCPAWPAGVVGSISHTAGYAAAIVDQGDAPERGLGVDVEHLGRVEPHLFERLFTAIERDRLATLPAESREEVATAAFGLKEAFYKAQFPRTSAWVGFSDVQVEFDPADQTAVLRPATDLDVLHAFSWPIHGRWTRRDALVVSAVEAWPASSGLSADA